MTGIELGEVATCRRVSARLEAELAAGDDFWTRDARALLFAALVWRSDEAAAEGRTRARLSEISALLEQDDPREMASYALEQYGEAFGDGTWTLLAGLTRRQPPECRRVAEQLRSVLNANEIQEVAS